MKRVPAAATSEGGCYHWVQFGCEFETVCQPNHLEPFYGGVTVAKKRRAAKKKAAKKTAKKGRRKKAAKGTKKKARRRKAKRKTKKA